MYNGEIAKIKACQMTTAELEPLSLVLRSWASIADVVSVHRSTQVRDWEAANLIIDAVGPKLAAEAERLKALLIQSRRRLAPFDDPFDLDLGLHRWLDGEREEAYSDWLEWVVRQGASP